MPVLGGEGGDKASVTGKDLAAALAPERGRAPVLNKEVAELKARYIKDAGKSIFEADVAQNEGDLMVNFDEMRRVLDSEQKRVDAEKDIKKKGELQKRYNRLQLRYNVYDKLLNNEGVKAMDNAEQQEIINAMSTLPGFAEAASVAIGGRLTSEQMMKVLSGKSGVSISADERKALTEVITSMVNDDRFKNRLSKSLASLKMGDDDARISKDIDDLKYKIREKDEVQKKLDNAKGIKKDFETKYPTKEKRDELKIAYGELNELTRALMTQFKPRNYSDGELDRIATQLADLSTKYEDAAKKDPQMRPQADAVLAQLNTFSEVAKLSVGRGSQFTELEKYAGALSTVEETERALREYSKDEKDIVSKEAERGKYSDLYKRKMEFALPEEMKRYWNEVALENATKAAQAQAAIKAEEDEKTKDLEKKRVEVASDMFKRFTELSFIKYKNGKVKGWCDKDLKQFVKKDLFSRSPKQMAREVLQRIIDSRAQLPNDNRKEIDGLLRQMGVGLGNPPATVRTVLDAIDGSEYQKWAEEKVPEIMGYGKARGYYFDRMTIKPVQAEFLLRSYGDAFFDKAAAAQAKYAAQTAKFMGGELKEFINRSSLKKKEIQDSLSGRN